MDGNSKHRINLEGIGDKIMSFLFENNFLDVQPMFDGNGNIEGSKLIVAANVAEQLEKLIEEEIFTF